MPVETPPTDCAYCQRKGDDRPHRGYYWCDHLAVELGAHSSRCDGCQSYTTEPLPEPAAHTAATPPAPQQPAVSDSPSPAGLPMERGLGGEDPAVLCAHHEHYRSQEGTPAQFCRQRRMRLDDELVRCQRCSDYVPGPTQPAKEQPAMPAMPAAKTRKVDWAELATVRFPDAPAGVTLRSHCRQLLKDHEGERGYLAQLSRLLGINGVSLKSAVQETRRNTTEAAKPAAPAPVVTGGGQPVPEKTQPEAPATGTDQAAVGGATGPDAVVGADAEMKLTLRDIVASTEDDVHQVFDLINELGPHALAEYLVDQGLLEDLRSFGRGWTIRGRRLMLEAAS